MSIETCPVEVWVGYSSHKCGRRVKEDGLCGIHLAARRGRQKRSAEYNEMIRADKAAKSESQNRIERLANYGIAADASMVSYFSPRGPRHTGGITITDPEMVEKLLKMLEDRS